MGLDRVLKAVALVDLDLDPAAGDMIEQGVRQFGALGGIGESFLRAEAVRLVKGSHIVLPRLYEGEHAFILQNDDGRVIFMIPFEDRFTLVGTTDVDYDGDPGTPTASEAEADYLCHALGRYLARPPAPSEALWSYAGVRPLYDDGSADPSAITRDYTLRVDDGAGQAPGGRGD